jgi:hypothetical protein
MYRDGDAACVMTPVVDAGIGQLLREKNPQPGSDSIRTEKALSFTRFAHFANEFMT